MEATVLSAIGQTFGGLGMQLLWTAVGALVVAAMWRFALRAYTAVGI